MFFKFRILYYGGNAVLYVNAYSVGNNTDSKAMRANHYLQKGLISKKFDNKDHDGDGLFSLEKFFKKIFTRFKVSFVDDCCDIPADEQTALPVRYNAVEEQLEYYNPDNDTWTAVS